MDSEKAQFEPSYDALRNLINMEFQRNINEYTSFLVSRSPYEEVEKYLNERTYSHEIGDIIINILANVTIAHISMKVAKEMNIFSRILLHLDLVLSTGKCSCSKGVNIMIRLLIEILKEQVLLKIKVLH